MKIMLDLETLSTKSNAAIVAIGAVAFTEMEVDVSSHFYRVITPESCDLLGMHISGSTFSWWCQQSDAARAMFSDKSAGTIDMALKEFDSWCRATKVDEMWGNGADFDCVILGSAYEAAHIGKPWSYSKNRCFRTLKSRISPEEQNILWTKYATGTHHNALDDAVRQAKIAVDIFGVGK